MNKGAKLKIKSSVWRMSVVKQIKPLRWTLVGDRNSLAQIKVGTVIPTDRNNLVNTFFIQFLHMIPPITTYLFEIVGFEFSFQYVVNSSPQETDTR